MLSVLSRIIDIAMAGLGALLAAALHHGRFVWLDDMQSVAVAFDGVLVIVFFPAMGIYQSGRGKPVHELLWRVAGAWLIVEGTGILLTFSMHRSDMLSRLWLGYWALCTIALLMVSKALVNAILKRLRREGFNQKAVAIVSGGQYAQFLIQQMRRRPDAGFSPICVFNDEEGSVGDAIAGVRIERDFAMLTKLVRSRAIRELWLA